MPETIGKVPGRFASGTLSDSGTLLFVCCPEKPGLFMVPPTGGEPTEIEVPGLGGRGQEAYLSPAFQKGELFWNTRFSPDARWIVFQVEGTQQVGIPPNGPAARF